MIEGWLKTGSPGVVQYPLTRWTEISLLSSSCVLKSIVALFHRTEPISPYLNRDSTFCFYIHHHVSHISHQGSRKTNTDTWAKLEIRSLIGQTKSVQNPPNQWMSLARMWLVIELEGEFSLHLQLIIKGLLFIYFCPNRLIFGAIHESR